MPPTPKDQDVKPFVNRREIESPLKHWPGHIKMPVEISAEDFAQYWETLQRQIDEKDRRYEIIRAWENRFHLVKHWQIAGLDSEQITEDAMKMPSMLLVSWVVDEANKLIEHSLTLPNSDAPSSDAEKPSEMAPSR